MLGKVKQYLREHTEHGKSRYLNFLYRYDMQRYLKHSGMNGDQPENAATSMRILVHALEKGMSLSHVRAGYGREKVKTLIELYDQYEKCESRKDEQVLAMARSAVRGYAEFQKERGEDISFIDEPFLERCRSADNMTGIITVEKKSGLDFAAVAHSRHSIRSFSGEKIDPERLRQAVSLAQTAPSACNRQATHVYVCQTEEKIKSIIAMHGGLKGFDFPAAILAVTGDLTLYQSEYERNTVFVDGGIFLMNLLYALDSLEIAACPIIWGAEPDNDKKLSELLNIPEEHEIVSLVVVGAFPEEAKAARSFKRPTETILHFS